MSGVPLGSVTAQRLCAEALVAPISPKKQINGKREIALSYASRFQGLELERSGSKLGLHNALYDPRNNRPPLAAVFHVLPEDLVLMRGDELLRQC